MLIISKIDWKNRWKQKCKVLNASPLYNVENFHLGNARKKEKGKILRKIKPSIYTHIHAFTYIYIHTEV